MGKVKQGSYDNATVTNYGFYAIFGLVIYFIWCDLAFFGELSAEKTPDIENQMLVSHNTVKLRMLDHFGHYIYLPLCRWANDFFLLSEYHWMSPNLVTAVHFCVAVCCGRLFASSSATVRRIGVIIFEFRSCLDALDGVIFRAQMKSKELLSGWGTYGYMIDGVADTLGGLFIMMGTMYRYNKYPPLKNTESLNKIRTRHKYIESNDRLLKSDRLVISDNSSSDVVEEMHGVQRYSRKHANLVLLFFTITVIMRSALWDHFNHSYHNLLGVRRTDISPEKQLEAFNYGSTSFCIWLWKIHSADAFLHYTLLASFFGKLWRWLKFNLYAAIPNMIIIGLICQFNIMQVRILLGVSE